jgi:hypothetical protein
MYSQKIAWQLASNVDNYVVFDVERRQTNMNVGAVGALRSVKGAIEAAKLVMEHTEHTLLVGDQASQFALALGLPGPANLSTAESLKACHLDCFSDGDCRMIGFHFSSNCCFLVLWSKL